MGESFVIFYGLFNDFSHFYKVNFSAKKNVVFSCVHGVQKSYKRRDEDENEKTSFKMQERNLFGFLFKSLRHCVRNNRCSFESLMDFLWISSDRRMDTWLRGACTFAKDGNFT